MPGHFAGLRTDTLPWKASNSILRAMRYSTIASPGCFARIFVVFPRVGAFPDISARIFADYPRKYRCIPHVIPKTAVTCGHSPARYPKKRHNLRAFTRTLSKKTP